MPKFDVAAAKAAGMSDKEIQDYMSQNGLAPAQAPAQTANANPDDIDTSGNALDRGAHFVGQTAKQVNPVAMVRGAKDLVTNPVGTLDAAGNAGIDTFKQAVDHLKQGDYVGGIARLLYSAIPFYGSQLNKGANQLQAGDLAGGFGTTLGVGLNLAAPAIIEGAVPRISKAVGKTGNAVYRGAFGLKGPKANAIADTAMDAGVSTPDGLSNAISDRNVAVGRAVDSAPQTRSILTKNTADALDNLKSDLGESASYSKQQAAVDAQKEEFLNKFRPAGQSGTFYGKLTPREAQDIKTATYKTIRGRKKGAYLEPDVNDASTQALQTINDDLKGQIENAAPDVAKPNRELSQLYDLEDPMSERIQANSNRKPWGEVASGVGAGLATHSPITGAAVATIYNLFKNPAFQAKLAIALHDLAGLKPPPGLLRGGAAAGSAAAAAGNNPFEPLQ